MYLKKSRLLQILSVTGLVAIGLLLVISSTFALNKLNRVIDVTLVKVISLYTGNRTCNLFGRLCGISDHHNFFQFLTHNQSHIDLV